MAQPPRKATDAAEVPDDFAMIGHNAGVRAECKFVKVESVRVPCDTLYVPTDVTNGAKLRAMMARAGLSQRGLARAMGFAHASSLQRYVDVENDRPFGVDVVHRLADALAGRGSPAITRDEVLLLAGLERPEPNALVVPMEGASLDRMREDLPIFGTALGAERYFDGEAVEQTFLNQGEIVAYVKRPVILNGRADAYGLYVMGSSMYPVHHDGALVLVERKRPPRIGDDVVVYLRPESPDDDDGERARGVLVKRLVRRTASYVELEQFMPAKRFVVATDAVVRIDRVMTLGDLLE